VWTLDDRIRDRIQASDYTVWRARVEAIGGCARPIRLAGSSRIVHTPTGALVDEHAGTAMVPCGNRRASVCPTCSDRYAADAFHLIRAGLSGGDKGIPTTVTDRPRAFVTLTPPSFGQVHNRAHSTTGKALRCPCGQRHHEYDTRIGAPLDPDGYDYVAAVLWQAHTGVLWHRFTTRLRREIAKRVGIRVRDFAGHARLSYGKVAEYQRRGLVHFHAVIRLDGPDGATDPPPEWATPELLTDAAHAAAGAVLVATERPDGARLELRWGGQVDVRPIIRADEIEDEDGQITEQRLAGYIAKYATKGTGKSEAVDRPVRSQMDIDNLNVSTHHRRMIQTAWDLGDLESYVDLNLKRWAHMLGYRGHFLTKSRAYSVTFQTLRGDRRAYRLTERLTALGIPTEDLADIAVINDWEFTGAGYDTDAEQELAAAIADRTREARKRKHHTEQEQRP
jgi:replication initiator protein RepSA